MGVGSSGIHEPVTEKPGCLRNLVLLPALLLLLAIQAITWVWNHFPVLNKDNKQL